MSSQASPHVAILGAGPIGLEAALAAADRGLPFTVYEAADRVGASVRDWAHVRLFSSWSLNVSPRVRRRLRDAGAEPAHGEGYPTGGEFLEAVLEPLAALPEIAPRLRLGHRIVAVSRDGLVKSDEIGTGARAHRPFRLLAHNGSVEAIERADVVLDCTGSYEVPNALGDGGIPAPGEAAVETAGRLARRIPDLDDPETAALYAGRTTLLVGAGHSAQTAVRDLAELAERRPGSRVIWALRGTASGLTPLADDPLAERARLMARARELAAGAADAVEVRSGVVVESLDLAEDAVRVSLRPRDADSGEAAEHVTVDRVLALTGSLGDARLYRQLQVHECYATCGPMKLAAALLGESGGGDCLAQTGHGAETLLNPEPGFFILGSKSYGRNSTFLMRIGWEQVEDALGLLRK